MDYSGAEPVADSVSPVSQPVSDYIVPELASFPVPHAYEESNDVARSGGLSPELHAH